MVALLTNTMTPQLFLGTDSWVTSCQTYEGGFSAVPGTEAHGGYTFCGFAAAVLLKATELVDMKSLLVCVFCYFFACTVDLGIENAYAGLVAYTDR